MLSEWLQAHGILVGAFAIISLAAFVGTLIAIPLFVRNIPVDYLTREQPPPTEGLSQSPVRFLSAILRNLLGLLCILVGLAMLVLPGQGLLTILVGVMLVDFPGKFTLERRLMLQPTVFRAINWMRAKTRKPALEAPSSIPSTPTIIS